MLAAPAVPVITTVGVVGIITRLLRATVAEPRPIRVAVAGPSRAKARIQIAFQTSLVDANLAFICT